MNAMVQLAVQAVWCVLRGSLFLLGLSCCPVGVGAQTAASLPLWGSYGGPACQGQDRLQRFDELVGRPQTVVIDFLAAENWQAMVSTARLVARCHPAGQGRRLVVSVPLLPRTHADQIDLVALGAHDADFVAVARALVGSGHRDAIVRLGWEFNGGWYPWRAKGREDLWKAAWRRAVVAMRSVDGQAFLFDWSYSLSDHDAYPFERAYPGDDVVDIIGVDFYNQTWFSDSPGDQLRWQRYLKAPRGLNWLSEFASERNKWISMPEWGTGYRPDGHGRGDSPDFVTRTLRWIDQHRVLYHAYWNYPAKDYRAELVGNDLQGTRAAYVEGMRARVKPVQTTPK